MSLVDDWLTAKGLTHETLAMCGVRAPGGDKLRFEFRAPTGEPAGERFFDLASWASNDPERQRRHRLWERGSHARGALWWPDGSRGHIDLTGAGVAVVCEGETDALAACQQLAVELGDAGAPDLRWALGGFAVCAVPGAETLHASIVDALALYDVVLTVFDADAAGRRAEQRAAAIFAEVGQPTYRVRIEDGQDLRDALAARGAGAREWLVGQIAPLSSAERVLPAPPPVPLRPAAAAPPRAPAPGEQRDEPKPDVRVVWQALGLHVGRERVDGQGRHLTDCRCPIPGHESTSMTAWCGDDKWGCWRCCVTADVYELVAIVRGMALPNERLTSETFKRVRAETLALVGAVAA